MRKFSPMKFLLVLLALTFVVHQFVSAVYKPITTENTYFYTANNGIDITGVVIRNETLVTTSKNGVLHFMIPDGNRVSNDGVIANIYQDEEASIALSEIATVKNKIMDLEDILSQNSIEAANLEVANNNVNNKFNELILSTSYGNFSMVSSDCESLLSAVNRRRAVLGETTNFSQELASLNSELASLEKSLSNPVGKIKAEQSGYFISKIDGYETAFDTSDLSKITPSFLSELSKKEKAENVVGKIVSDYEWYIAASVSVEDSLKFKEGENLSIHTTVKSAPVLPVTVKKINLSKDGGQAVIIFACSHMNSELATMRTGAMTVVKKEYSGLRITKKALRVVDSVKGVYVVSGMQIKFVPVEIVYTCDEFILCEKSDKDGALKLYDQVVVKGKNLYDGKIIS